MPQKDYNLKPPEQDYLGQKSETSPANQKGKYDGLALFLVLGGLIADIAIMALRRGRK